VETFVIRLCTAADWAGRLDEFALRGYAEHVRGGEGTAFSNAGELLAFLELVRARAELDLKDALRAPGDDPGALE
jgi:hypothetical protein